MDFQILAKGIALAGCAIGAGCSLIAGIGPGIGEGNAVAKALEAGAHAITLGRRILRTETAGLAILSVLMFQLEKE